VDAMTYACDEKATYPMRKGGKVELSCWSYSQPPSSEVEVEWDFRGCDPGSVYEQ
jgi:hypothetical protein